MRSDLVPPDAESSTALDLVNPAQQQEQGSTVRRYIIWSYQHAAGAPYQAALVTNAVRLSAEGASLADAAELRAETNVNFGSHTVDPETIVVT
ncbi:hypothetical protein ACFW4O_10170 [Streptomyces mutabilis]|uniref:hypothetical protein n=1 Tax=Streptomyces mutabilis TaxID=67332 RepID=UPI0036B223DC